MKPLSRTVALGGGDCGDGCPSAHDTRHSAPDCAYWYINVTVLQRFTLDTACSDGGTVVGHLKWQL